MSAEKEVRRRLASRSSRFAREAGIEIVRRTALIESEYELGGMTVKPRYGAALCLGQFSGQSPSRRRSSDMDKIAKGLTDQR